jgi:ABC-type multidrug transport system ATPase subunit
MNHTERENRIREVCAEVGYTRSLQFRPAKLSMGEQKLIAFARAMLCKPPLLFLDEWTESLDDDAAGRLVGIVRRLKAEGRTIIFVSHDLRLIESLADYVIMIKEGRISLSVTGEQITEDSTTANLVQREIDQCDLEYALSIR